MNRDIQNRIVGVLSALSGEEVTRVFLDWKGRQLLDDGFAQFLVDRQIATEYELGLDEGLEMNQDED